MSTVIKLDNMDAYVLHNMMLDRDATNDKPPLLGRSIMSGATKWKSNTVKFTGDSFFIPGYWEWTEDVLSRYGDILELCSVRNAVYASLYSYDKDTNILHAFCESWCPSTNTLHTMASEFSISLWDLYKLGGLPISGRIYDEAVPDIHTCVPTQTRASDAFRKHIARLVSTSRVEKGCFSAQQWVDFWCKRSISYNAPVKRKRYTGAPPKSTHNPNVEARRVIHEGSGAKNIFLFDDGNLDHTQMSYLSSLRSGYVSLRHYDSFFIEPYLPYRFSRQFGFCQDIPSAITRKVQDRSNVSYEKVLMFWKLLLFQGSMSRVCAPCLSLDWHKLKTVKFHGWWTKVTIKDLRHNIDKLCSAVESSSPNLKRVSPHDEARDAHRSADGHASDMRALVEGEDKSTSDASLRLTSNTRGRRSKKPRTADLEGDETDFRNAFENIPIPSDIPIDLNQVGDMDFEMGASFNIDDAMIGEATEPLNVLTDRPNPGKGKDIHMERDLVERSNSASPVQTHHSVDGPSTFEINAKTLCIPLDAKGIPRAPSHGDAAPAPPISTIRVTPASQGIFTSAIRILGNEYLTLLKQTPFDKVSERHGEAPQVYKAIRVMHGDPEPLKCKVDEYVWAVKSHLALKASLSDRRRSDQVEEERLAIEKELRLAESRLEEEGAALKKKEDELLKELEDVRQRIDQVANDLDDNRNSLTTLEATVHTTKRRVEELEAVPVCNAEEMELFEEQERKLLEFQSSLDICEWMV
ncbi:E3 ubiquitin-protein ligase TRIM71 [Bienertia sinuspersici]